MLDIVYSAYQAENTDVLAKILKLYAWPGARCLDMTYGLGVFWKRAAGYEVWSNDIDKDKPADYHYDARNTEFDDAMFDATIVDPPYAVKKAGRHHKGSLWAKEKRPKGDSYLLNTNASYGGTGGREHAAHDRFGIVNAHMTAGENIELYLAIAKEAYRVLRPRCVLILKTQDNATEYKLPILMKITGFRLEDLFVVVQKGIPPWDPKWKKQNHARKNHSYFIVHRKV